MVGVILIEVLTSFALSACLRLGSFPCTGWAIGGDLMSRERYDYIVSCPVGVWREQCGSKDECEKLSVWDDGGVWGSLWVCRRGTPPTS